MRICRCGRIVKNGCPVCDKAKNCKTTTERGYTYDHRKASERYRIERPLCERCVRVNGVLHANPSEDMHHIESIADNPKRRMDRGNWLAVCCSCHEELEGDVAAGIEIKRWSESNYEDLLNGQG